MCVHFSASCRLAEVQVGKAHSLPLVEASWASVQTCHLLFIRLLPPIKHCSQLIHRGGSIRVPSGQSGCYGLRPSTARIPYLGASNSCEGLSSLAWAGLRLLTCQSAGQEGVSSVLGPLSVSPDGLKAFMQGVLQRKPWERDPQGMPLPWRRDEYELVNHDMGRRLCFAFMWDDGCVKPMAPNIRALQITRDALLAAGHEVIDWMPYKHQESWDILSTIWTADGGVRIPSTGSVRPH